MASSTRAVLVGLRYLVAVTASALRRLTGLLAVAAALVTTSVAAAQPGVRSVAQPLAAGSSDDQSCRHDAAAEAFVRRELRRRVGAYLAPGQRVAVAFDCPSRIVPWRLAGLRTHGHAGGLDLLSVESVADDSLVIQSAASRCPTAEIGKSANVRFARSSIAGASAHIALARARAALAARVSVTEPVSAPGTMSSAVTMTDDDEDLDLRVGDGTSATVHRWSGYVGSDTESSRAPLELAWDTFWSLLPASARPESPDQTDHWVFSRVWRAEYERRPWVHRALLDVASVLGQPELAHDVAADLDSPDRDVRVLAVNALAHVSGRDLRRDSTGAVRPLDSIVADYKGLLRGR